MWRSFINKRDRYLKEDQCSLKAKSEFYLPKKFEAQSQCIFGQVAWNWSHALFYSSPTRLQFDRLQGVPKKWRVCAIFQAGVANFLLQYVQNMLWTLLLAIWVPALIQGLFKHIAMWLDTLNLNLIGVLSWTILPSLPYMLWPFATISWPYPSFIVARPTKYMM